MSPFLALTYDNYTSNSSDDSNTVKALVEEVYVKAGQRVKEGDPIAKLSTDEIEESLNTLKQSYKEAQLALEKAKLDQTSGQIAAKATLQQRLNDAENADRNFDLTLEEADSSLGTLKVNMNNAGDRVDQLEDEIDALEEQPKEYKAQIAALQQAISDAQAAGEDTTALEQELAELKAEADEFDRNYRTERQKLYTALSTAYSTYETAKLKFEIASNSTNLNEATAEAKREEALSYTDKAQQLYDLEIAQLANAVSSREITVENLQKKIDKMEAYVSDGQVKATCDGLIMNVRVVAGDKVSPDGTLATIANSKNVYISVDIDQTDISTITLGKEANIFFDAYPEKTFTGKVDSITTVPAMSNSSTVSYQVKVKLEGDLEALYEGMTGSVTFISKEVKDVLKVSNRAIYTENGKTYVKVKDASGTITPTEVAIGFKSDTETEIQSGVNEGDIVIIESKVQMK
ncbi:MAG: efflux RND transporter periplasmic adaptor subunit [Angelakisella sp.]